MLDTWSKTGVFVLGIWYKTGVFVLGIWYKTDPFLVFGTKLVCAWYLVQNQAFP